MKIGVLIAVILYEVITIVGVGIVIAIKNRQAAKNAGDFAVASKGLGTIQVGVTLALTMLGSAHIWGTTQNAFNIGAISVWFGIACAVMMVVRSAALQDLQSVRSEQIRFRICSENYSAEKQEL